MTTKQLEPMKNSVTLAQVEDKIITVRGQSVLLDSDVATLYAVETREVNQAIQRNPGKFPEGYIIQLDKTEWQDLKSQFVIFEKKEPITNCDKFTIKHSPVPPKAFTEKGLYMLATILKGERATQTTIAIVETYSKIRELAHTVARLAEADEKFQQQSLMQKSGEIMADILGEGMKTTDTETSIELNLAILKFKHVVKKRPE